MNRDTAWKVTEIYIATMGYAPDNEGLQYWVSQINSSSQWTVDTVAQSFFDQPLVQQVYPNASDFGSLVNALYANIFNRQADEDGYSYWIGELTSGSLTANQMIIAMINGGWDNTDPQAVSDISRFSNQVEVALEFAEYQSINGIVYSELSDADQIYIRQAGRDILANITESEATVEEAINSIPALLATLEAANGAPIANDDSATVTENEFIVINVLENDSDPDGDALTISSITQGDHGSVEIMNNGLELRYTPDPNYSGNDLFEYTVTDSNSGNTTARVFVAVEDATPYQQLRLELPLGDGWTSGSNSINFDLVFPSVATLENVSLQGGGALSLSSSRITLGGQTTASYSMTAANGAANGALVFDFDVSEEGADDLTVQIQGLIVNGEYLGAASYVVEGNSLVEFSSEPGLDFELIQETLEIDTIGYDTNYSNFADNLLTLPNAQIGTISNSAPTQAYLHIDEGEDFVFDHDSFELHVDESNDYRIKITPEDPGFFQGNIIAWTYNADGSRPDLIMNLIGDSGAFNVFVDGSLYSDVFSMTADERKYMSLSMRWRGEAGEKADGPAAYKVEMIPIGEPDFEIIQEAPEFDTTGYDTNYSNFADNLLTLPNAQIGTISEGAPTQAYLHIDEGEDFVFDHDSFELHVDERNDYRIKITPEDPGFFQGNIIAWTYNADGSSSDLIMNLIGGSDAFIEGALYSDVFSMTADERKYMSLSMRWRGEAGERADGPAPYTVELEVVGTAESSYDDMLFL